MQTVAEQYALAVNHYLAGRLNEAEQICRQVLTCDPNQIDAVHLLGVIALQVGGLEFAIECFRRAIALDATRPDFYCNLGNALQAQGQGEEAIACFRRALELKPAEAAAHNSLGAALQAQGKLPEAVDCYRRAVELKPDYVEAYSNLGIALKRLGNRDEAITAFHRALAWNPNDTVAAYHLGTVFQQLGRLGQAIQCFEHVLALEPNQVRTLRSLGSAYIGKGELNNAVTCLRKAIELKPEDAEAHSHLGTAFLAQGNLDQAVESYRYALQLKPDYAPAHSNLLVTLQYRDGMTLASLAAAHDEYERLHAAPLQIDWQIHRNSRDPNRRLRLGFISRDFGRHPVGYLIIHALENLDTCQFETICYSDRILHDDLTRRFQAASVIWRDVNHLSDHELAETIRTDGVDILFDLAGHTANNRLLVFARKVAPLQVTWIGYVGATGLKAMDYLLADRYEVPLHAESHIRERVIRLPDAYVCYDPQPYAPPVSTLPALKAGFVTFGSFNNPSKITATVVEVWAKILQAVPRSRLTLKYPGMNDVSVAGRLINQFASHGIHREQLEFLGWSPHSELLAEYNRVDVALDPYPYSGCLTTCEALWMGVPVITCPGETFASRQSLSFLSTIGLAELIARDLNDYVEIAASLANDLLRLSSLRRGLRQQMMNSPLCDGPRFSRNLMLALREIWRAWCESPEK